MSTADSRQTLAIVLDHPVQHFSPAFRQLHESQSVRSSIIYWTAGEGGRYDAPFGQTVKWDIDLLDGYDWWSTSDSHPAGKRILSTWRHLQSSWPDVVVVFGWATPNALVAIAWCIASRTRFLLYGDTTWQHEREGLAGRGRRLFLRALLQRAAGAISTGAFNREFYIALGMNPEKIAEGVCPADVDFYRSRATTMAVEGNDTFVIGFAGKLIPRKGVHELLFAAALLGCERAWELRIIGDGPEREKLQELASVLGIESQVRFDGFKNQSEMPAALAACQVVVVPSTRDMRVLITTEAMAAGCVVIVSSQTAVWGAGDLVRPEVTGFVYQSGDAVALSRLLSDLSSQPQVLNRVAKEAFARLDEQSPAAFARHVERAVTRLG